MDTMQSKLKQKLLHILGNLKGGVITADEALQKIEQAYAEKAEKDFNTLMKEYNEQMKDIQ